MALSPTVKPLAESLSGTLFLDQPTPSEPLTVLYDGACPLCTREIAHVRKLSHPGSALHFVDISAEGDASCRYAAERPALLARFHVELGDGSRLDGASAFVAMWSRLPGWRWAARLARLPGALLLLEWAYRGFLRVRPGMQAWARRWDAAPSASPALSVHLQREMRSDHAGETGAVFIYRGLAAVARWRGNAELLAFAQRHEATEAEHLRLVESWIAPAHRSRLLGPWRLAGWLTGALPALAGPRAVYATIAAVETFVDQHYQQQIDHIRQHGAPDGLLTLLLRCQADELAHRDEAAALALGPASAALRAWCALVGAGSAAAVTLARRI